MVPRRRPRPCPPAWRSPRDRPSRTAGGAVLRVPAWPARAARRRRTPAPRLPPRERPRGRHQCVPSVTVPRRARRAGARAPPGAGCARSPWLRARDRSGFPHPRTPGPPRSSGRRGWHTRRRMPRLRAVSPRGDDARLRRRAHRRPRKSARASVPPAGAGGRGSATATPGRASHGSARARRRTAARAGGAR